MAELRWEVMFSSNTADQANAVQEFRNETSKLLHIRRIRWAIRAGLGAPDEMSEHELSKAPVFQSGTDESPFFTLPVKLAMPATGATPADGEIAENGEALFGRGHLTLEVNESVFHNYSQSADVTSVVDWVIAYEF